MESRRCRYCVQHLVTSDRPLRPLKRFTQKKEKRLWLFTLLAFLSDPHFYDIHKSPHLYSLQVDHLFSLPISISAPGVDSSGRITQRWIAYQSQRISSSVKMLHHRKEYGMELLITDAFLGCRMPRSTIRLSSHMANPYLRQV